jgi:hypothetical protein
MGAFYLSVVVVRNGDPLTVFRFAKPPSPARGEGKATATANRKTATAFKYPALRAPLFNQKGNYGKGKGKVENDNGFQKPRPSGTPF